MSAISDELSLMLSATIEFDGRVITQGEYLRLMSDEVTDGLLRQFGLSERLGAASMAKDAAWARMLELLQSGIDGGPVKNMTCAIREAVEPMLPGNAPAPA